MKVARFRHQDVIQFGIVDGDELAVLAGDPMFSGWETTGQRVAVSEVTLLAPVIPRSKVIAIGKNYVDHAAEMGGEVPEEPLMFFKPNTAVIGPHDAIILPHMSNQIEHEGELAIVIGAIARDVSEADAESVIFGYTCANDVTARDLQKRDGQWARAKGFDTFCPLGPVIETECDLKSARLETRVNDELRQSAALSEMVFGIPRIIAHVSRVCTLLPGDVILTGTPAGIGPLTAGDNVEVSITGIGTLRNVVRERS